MAPAVYFYGFGNYHGYGAYALGKEQYSLGNMGYAHVDCMTVPKELSAFPINCNVGYIQKINDVGINPSDNRQKDLCAVT